MRILLFSFSIIISLSVSAQNGRKTTRAEYIQKYKNLAMEEMRRTGIPASITLAQGILESGDGNSRLATKANNHFGIKCHDWEGPSINHDDDKKNECFRKYKSAEQSYRDHSDFLTTKKRYTELFELKADDYKAWAKGLKNTGYATSPTYAKALIQVIEENELYKYDQLVLNSKKETKKGKTNSGIVMPGGRELLYNNKVKYIIADSNDTFEKLTELLNLMSWQLPRYNELPENSKLKKGDFVYLQLKRNRAAFGYKVHVVQEGETIYSISQLYGVKEQKLRERNNIPENSEPKTGVAIFLRSKVKSNLPMSDVYEKPVKVSEEKKNKKNYEEVEFEIEYDLGD